MNISNTDHKHAVARIEAKLGNKITHIIKTFHTEAHARAAVHNGNKRNGLVRILRGQAYARLTDEGWMLDGEMTAAEFAAMEA